MRIKADVSSVCPQKTHGAFHVLNLGWEASLGTQAVGGSGGDVAELSYSRQITEQSLSIAYLPTTAMHMKNARQGWRSRWTTGPHDIHRQVT
jgi:hypothetical protein